MSLGAVGLAFEIGYLSRLDQASDKKDAATRSYLPIAITILIVYGVLFYLLRAKTHFLGDGYTLLAELSKENSLVKTRGLAEGLLHV